MKVKELILDEYNQIAKFVDLSFIGLGYGNFKKVLFSQNPEHNLHSITFNEEVSKELGIVDIKKEEEIWRDLFQLFTDNMIKNKKYSQEEWLQICKKNWNISEK
jgi:hypothetical protein